MLKPSPTFPAILDTVVGLVDGDGPVLELAVEV